MGRRRKSRSTRGKAVSSARQVRAPTRKSIYSEDSIRNNSTVRIFALIFAGYIGGVTTVTFLDGRYSPGKVDAMAADRGGNPPCFDLSTRYQDEGGKQRVTIMMDSEDKQDAQSAAPAPADAPATQCQRPCSRESQLDHGHTIRAPP